MHSNPSIIFVDARALQDDNYRYRGVGQHSSSLLRALRKHDWQGPRPKLVALTDAGMRPLEATHRTLFDRIDAAARRPRETVGTRWFLSLSPMTHDPVWAAEYLNDESLYRTALFYDLIPLEFPDRYLSSPINRCEYVVSLAWLRRYERFAAISRFSADALIERMHIDPSRVFVSGVAVRRSLEPLARVLPLPFGERDCIVVAGGGDPRKNPECAIVAHARSRILREQGIPITVFGSYPAPMREQFRALYAKHGGRAQDLAFKSHMSDEELHQLYRHARLVVVPSRAEGFSIPIIEANAAAAPVVVSDVGAHPELVKDAALRFDPDDSDRLVSLLESLAGDESCWQRAKKEQENLWLAYTELAVGSRLVTGLLEAAPIRSATVRPAKSRPDIAVFSPLPPAKSGVADYTAATLRPLKGLVNLHMYTASPDAHWEKGWTSLAPISSAQWSSRRFDRTLAVMGNSHHHKEVLDYLLTHGGACLAHDARQIDFYYHLRGPAYALEIARRELGREVPFEELSKWMREQRQMPTLFLSELVQASRPLLVHSPITAREIKRLYSVEPVVLPFAQYSRPLLDRLSPTERKGARSRLGLRDKSLVLVTFGFVSADKAPDELVWALHLLRTWGVDAELAFCGYLLPQMATPLTALVNRLDLSNHVRTFPEAVPLDVYNDFLVASDVGIQLRTYFMGGLSGALNDCVAAGLPSVANEHLAESMLAPSFVRRVPDSLSALLVAEAVLDIESSGQAHSRPIEEARAFARRHSPAAYCAQLLEALEVEVDATQLKD
jgi:glycosyltransferase involved in cell wall biosynthesis